MAARVYWLHALSPLHVGTGRGVGFIDLPIARESTTNWPLVPGSGVKGVVADHYGASADARQADAGLQAAFGSGGDDSANAGALVFTDARLACLPVRSLYGTFAWVSSALALRRLLRDLREATPDLALAVPEPPAEGHLKLVTVSLLADTQEGKVFFEDLDFVGAPCEATAAWAAYLAAAVFPGDQEWQTLFTQRFAVVPDTSFDFLCDTAVQVDARVRIDEAQKTVARGALWYEEALPPETILAGLVWCDRVFVPGVEAHTLLEGYCQGTVPLQVGGKATVGRGRVNCVFGN